VQHGKLAGWLPTLTKQLGSPLEHGVLQHAMPFVEQISLPVLTCPLSAVVWLPQHSGSCTARQASEQQVVYQTTTRKSGLPGALKCLRQRALKQQVPSRTP